MIPLATKSKLAEAKYTKLLNNIGPENLAVISTLFHSFGNNDDLYNHFISKYRYYEICDEEVGVFITCVRDIFNEHKDYFTQLLTAYNKDIDIDDITTKTSERTDTNAGNKSSTGSSTTSNTHKEYDLPNKQINPQNENGYLTSKDTNDGTGSATDSETHSNTYTSSNSSTDNREFIRLKREYLSHVRDIYEEFIDRFYDCFLHVY